MKFIAKLFRASALTVVIISLLAACALLADDGGVDNKDGPTHYPEKLEIKDQQVYVGTDSNKISGIYEKYAGEDGPIFIMTINRITVGNGEIKDGKLSFDVPPLDEEILINADAIKPFFMEYEEVNIDPPGVMSDIIAFEKSEDELLNREKYSGSSDSLWLESVIFYYVDRDCAITGKPSSGMRENESLYQTGDLNLALKKGWNTVCIKQLYGGARGVEEDSMEIKNPKDFKWVIRNFTL